MGKSLAHVDSLFLCIAFSSNFSISTNILSTHNCIANFDTGNLLQIYRLSGIRHIKCNDA